ncbi:hypothetical protein D9615_003159 [Tricholomella constricta]|uniref:Cytochrome P450 n=1 Tax=Tricholomella constricta TaxID=117010 RepID=A0A8H5M884_9AGAR|nr:hypothetical protein D9615_003159 [Tricholomella constricta]
MPIPTIDFFNPSLAGYCIFIAIFFLTFYWHHCPQCMVPLPPGPRPMPFIGNLKDMTTKELWLRATEWATQFGDVCYVHVFGQGIVFLNSADVAFELLEKRGAIYSDKPHLIMVGELCGCKDMLPFLSYGDAFKRRRKLMQQALGSRNIPNYYVFLEHETRSFIKDLLDDPSNYIRSIRRYAGGLTLSVIYGHKVVSRDDEFLILAEESMNLLANKLAPGPGIWPVDIFPFLRYLPSWFPGAAFKQSAREWKMKIHEFVEKPYAHALKRIENGDILPSFLSTILGQKLDLSKEAENDVKWAANSMYAASADTTISTVCNFFLAMIYNPDVLAKAQQELDEVIGSERLPMFSDRASLPYIECVLNETWRWGCPVPLNLPHSLREEDVFRGMRIPKGSLVIANIWAMLRDESLYPAASEFRPERFAKEHNYSAETRRKMDPRNCIFGFGRRRCPGADLVESSIWLLIATIIAMLDISKAHDADGEVIEPVVDYDNLVFR